MYYDHDPEFYCLESKPANGMQVLFHTLGIIMVDPAATDTALQALVAMARRNMASVPLALAIATGCVKLGQIPRARNQLKRIHVRSGCPAWCFILSISLCVGPGHG